MSRFLVIGTSHAYAPVELRERVACAEDEIGALLAELRERFASEAAILSTCNRTEIYLVPRDEMFGADDALRWLGENRGVAIDPANFFARDGVAAAHHLMEVASGVDSQVIGDIQILGQVKGAYKAAKENGALGPVLTRLFETALRAGKRVVTETNLFTGAVSISYVAVELAGKIFYPLADKRALVVGAGETGELTAQSLRGRGVTEITVTNRTEERGRAMLARLGAGWWLPWERLGESLAEFDIVIVATGARAVLLDEATVRRAAAARGGRQMLLVDLAVPRNVDPRVGEIPNVFYKDLNDLNAVIATNVERRREEIPAAEKVIAEELEEFGAWHRTAPLRPVVAELSRRAEAIARAMLEENRGRFSEKDFANVEKLVGGVVRKIIALPAARLLDPSDDPAVALERAAHVRTLFGLGDSEERE